MKDATLGSMSNAKSSRGNLPMLSLTLPIVFEQFFRVLVSSIDTYMLSSYSDKAVAAVGMTTQYLFFLSLLFSVICTGTSVVLAQYIGAEKSRGDLNRIAQASFIMIVQFAVVVTVVVFTCTDPLLSCYALEPEVRGFARDYFIIFGGAGAIFSAFSAMQAAILRCYGYTKEILVVSVIANVINVIGNSLSLYGFFGLPVFGVKGVALSSVLSQVVSCIIYRWIIRHRKDVVFNTEDIRHVPKVFYGKILSIGIPTAGESIAYNTAQIVIMAMITTIGTNAMAAQAYTQTIVRFTYVFAIALGTATQIKTGHYVGAGKSDEAYRKLYRYQAIGTAISVSLVVTLNFIKTPIIALFTDKIEISKIVEHILLWSIYIEFGRSLNLISIGGLKGSGDVRFPVLYGICSMWGIMVLGSYLLGLKLGLGLTGIWIATGTDETTRGIVMLLRWKSKRWQNKRIV